jgi:integrase
MPVRAIYRRAMDRDEVTINPTTGLRLPAAKGKRDRIAPPQEATRLLAEVPEGERALWATAFYAGLRVDELFALRWEDVDLDGGVIRVERSYDPKERQFIDVKSSASERNVPIPRVLRKFLMEHRKASGRREELVFGTDGETPFAYQAHRRHALSAWREWNKAETKRAEEEDRKPDLFSPIGFHEARHTFASLMIAAGVNMKAISTYMGHASITITMDRYGHLLPDSEKDAADKLDAYLAAVGP